MSAPARIAAFVAGLALLFAAAAVAGGAVDPDVEEDSTAHGMASEVETMEGHEMTGGAIPGLATSSSRETRPSARSRKCLRNTRRSPWGRTWFFSAGSARQRRQTIFRRSSARASSWSSLSY